MPLTVLVDIETDGLEYTKIHCIAMQILGVMHEPKLFTDVGEFNDFCYDEGVMDGARWVAHNGCGFDFHVINDLTDVTVDTKIAIDTLVLSKLVFYSKFGTHSLKELGQSLGVHKGDYEGGWEVYTPEMGEYCVQDVVVLEAIYNQFERVISNPKWAKSIEVEHRMAYICRDMQANGFDFDVSAAEATLDEVTADMTALEKGFDVAFPPKLKLAKTCKLRKKKNGDYYDNVINDFATYDEVKIREEDGEYDCYEFVPFNPGSPRDRIDVLWDAGWKPHEKTEGHKKKLKEARGWKKR